MLSKWQTKKKKNCSLQSLQKKPIKLEKKFYPMKNIFKLIQKKMVMLNRKKEWMAKGKV
jgi:hypothetical protein